MELRKYNHQNFAQIRSHFQNNNSSTSFESTLDSFKQSISEIPTFVLLGICIGAVLIITLIIVICCRKLHTRQLYEQSPQNFTHRPNLSLFQKWVYNKDIIPLSHIDSQKIQRKETYDGKFVQLTLKTYPNCIYFSNRLTSDCYFQIQAVKLSSMVQIGFFHIQDLHQICKQVSGEYQMNLDQYGVSVRTDGSVYVYGNNQLNYPWKIEYGDTLGIGITEHERMRRVWITKNGVIQNPPSQEEMIKHIDFSSQKDQNKTTIKKKKVQELDIQEEERKQRQEADAAKKKIQLKTSRKFKYHAVIIAESPMEPRRQTVLNWNIGGQSFRLYDAKKFVGLLR